MWAFCVENRIKTGARINIGEEGGKKNQQKVCNQVEINKHQWNKMCAWNCLCASKHGLIIKVIAITPRCAML